MPAPRFPAPRRQDPPSPYRAPSRRVADDAFTPPRTIVTRPEPPDLSPPAHPARRVLPPPFAEVSTPLWGTYGGVILATAFAIGMLILVATMWMTRR